VPDDRRLGAASRGFRGKLLDVSATAVRKRPPRIELGTDRFPMVDQVQDHNGG
jgi:hypothetical protein